MPQDVAAGIGSASLDRFPIFISGALQNARPSFNSPFQQPASRLTIIWPVHSLEPEWLELNAGGLIEEATATRAVALERGVIFSLLEELRFALYTAVASITAGIGILLKEHAAATKASTSMRIRGPIRSRFSMDRKYQCRRIQCPPGQWLNS